MLIYLQVCYINLSTNWACLKPCYYCWNTQLKREKSFLSVSHGCQKVAQISPLGILVYSGPIVEGVTFFISNFCESSYYFAQWSELWILHQKCMKCRNMSQMKSTNFRRLFKYVWGILQVLKFKNYFLQKSNFYDFETFRHKIVQSRKFYFST